MKGDTFTKVMAFLIFVLLAANVVTWLFQPRPTQAQVPQILIAQATEKIAQANEQIATALGKLASAVYEGNSRIAEVVERSASR